MDQYCVMRVISVNSAKKTKQKTTRNIRVRIIIQKHRLIKAASRLPEPQLLIINLLNRCFRGGDPND
jgi:hypothetical protein